MESLYSCSEYSSLHGVHHFVRAGLRKYGFRVCWAAVFVLFTTLLAYFQFNLFYEIVVKKPTVIERYYERTEWLNFPNVVICDMNQEFDKLKNLAETTYGNITILVLLTMQLSVSLLYQPIRLKLRENTSLALDEFPILSQQYADGYSHADPNWIKILSLFALFCSLNLIPNKEAR